MTEFLLEMVEVSKRFGDVSALTDVSLRVASGSLHALLGENGAGKTTLMNIAYGLVRPDQGTIIVSSKRRRLRSPLDALDAGVGMVQQHFSLVPAMSVAENIALGMHGRYRVAETRSMVKSLSEETGLAVDPDARVADLSIGAQQRVEILKALARSTRVLILDEPTAVLSPQEGEELLRWIRAFCVPGRAAVLITHKLEEARAFADTISVLRNGSVAAQAKTSDLSSDQLVQAMLGEVLVSDVSAHRGSSSGAVAVRVDRVTIRDARGVTRIRDASFEVRTGEIVGVAGVEGAGHHELLRAVAGRLKPSSGSIAAPERVGYVPDDRLVDGLIPQYDLRQNLALRGAGSRRGLMRWRQLEELVLSLVRAFDVRTPNARVEVRTLSGGNQQKFVFARELHDQPDLLVAVNPTRGLDIRASQALLERLRDARASGKAVIMHSNDVDELLACCDRVLVVYAGQLTPVPRDREQIGRAMVGTA